MNQANIINKEKVFPHLFHIIYEIHIIYLETSGEKKTINTQKQWNISNKYFAYGKLISSTDMKVMSNENNHTHLDIYLPQISH